MIKSVDYTEQHKMVEEKIAEQCRTLAKEHTLEKLHLLEQIIETELRQYRYIKDHEKRNRVETRYYPFLCELAKIHGARVTLDIDERFYYAALTYTGGSLIFDNSYPMELNYFTQLFKDCDTVSLEGEQGQIRIQFTFEMHHKEKTADNKQELQKLKETFKLL